MEILVGLEGSGEGSVVSDPPGIDCPDTECSLLVAPGAQVTLTAQAADPWFSFTGWGGDVDCPGTGPCTFNADDHVFVTATFELSSEVFVGLEGSGEGSVVSDPPGIDCPDMECSLLVAPGAQVTLTAQAADPWFSFTGWGGDVDCPGTGSCTFNADVGMFVTATFEPSSEVFVGLEGSGEGSVVSDPPGINCPDTECSLLVAPGTQVTLTAQAVEPWSSFIGWSGDVDCPGTGSCTFNADVGMLVTATFEPSSEVFVGLEGSGEGSVVSDPAGIDCPDADCFMLVFPGTEVTLTAQAADPWYFFTGWGGDVDCPGTGPCTFNATNHVHVSANFEHGILADIFLEGDGQGTVTSDPQGVDCPDQDCYAYFAPVPS